MSTTIPSIIATLAQALVGPIDETKCHTALAQLMQLRDEVLGLDEALDTAERSPTGDDYNDVIQALGLTPASIAAAAASQSQWFIISGRIPGDEEDTTMVIEADNVTAAREVFIDNLYSTQPDGTAANVRAQYGCDHYITAVHVCSTPVVEA